jgi:hypothetical protein
VRGAEMKIIRKIAGYALCLILIIFLLNLTLSFSAAESKTPPKVVAGKIEEIRSYTIKVKGKEYDISNVPVLTARGIMVTKDNLAQGSEVEIRFNKDKITSIVIKNRRYINQ